VYIGAALVFFLISPVYSFYSDCFQDFSVLRLLMTCVHISDRSCWRILLATIVCYFVYIIIV